MKFATKGLKQTKELIYNHCIGCEYFMTWTDKLGWFFGCQLLKEQPQTRKAEEMRHIEDYLLNMLEVYPWILAIIFEPAQPIVDEKRNLFGIYKDSYPENCIREKSTHDCECLIHSNPVFHIVRKWEEREGYYLYAIKTKLHEIKSMIDRGEITEAEVALNIPIKHFKHNLTYEDLWEMFKKFRTPPEKVEEIFKDFKYPCIQTCIIHRYPTFHIVRKHGRRENFYIFASIDLIIIKDMLDAGEITENDLALNIPINYYQHHLTQKEISEIFNKFRKKAVL